jgi:hypothetical protein
MHQTQEYWEEATYRSHAFLSTSSVENFVYYLVGSFLESGTEQRFNYFGYTDDLKASSSNSRLSSLPLPDDIS